MINSHKELIDELVVWVAKMPLINEFKYLRSIDSIAEDILNSEPRTFVVGLDGVQFDDKNYNVNLRYRFAIADRCLSTTETILVSETENIFILSALADYLSYIKDTEFSLTDIDFSTESDTDSSYVSAFGTFSFVVKRSPSFWTGTSSEYEV